MIVYRLGLTAYSRDLSGRGAELSGGRWNSRGRAMLYTCDSRALCVTELAVHLPLGIIPVNYSMTHIEIPDTLPVYELQRKDYPADWKVFPHPASTKQVGDEFLEKGKYPVMKVFSSVVDGDFNYLINPAHRDARLIRVTEVGSFTFSERLFRR